MGERYGVIVIGAGSVGSAAAYHLAARGQRVLVLERFAVPHTMGSHHGAHRIYRFAYAEGSSYVPLMRSALERWLALEAEWGEPLHRRTGGLDIGPPDSDQVSGALASCRVHGLDHEVLDAEAVHERFPAWHLGDGVVAVHQPEAGMVFPERCVAAHVAGALRRGAEVRALTQVLGWDSDGDGVVVHTDEGDDRRQHRADRLVIAGGAWLPQLVPSLAPLLRPTRQLVCWFTAVPATQFAPSAFPVWIAEVDEGHFYGFPEAVTPGVKIGWHEPGPSFDPDTPDRSTSAADETAHRRFVRRYLPGADGPTLARGACLYTMSPDEHFIFDALPGAPQVVVFGGDSGHAFKFASELGAIAADLAIDGSTSADITAFRLDRFDQPTS
ncbi:MAG TPA: N-methyl-L-tryptophan oxidase [Acidimicrobiales bacterium]